MRAYADDVTFVEVPCPRVYAPFVADGRLVLQDKRDEQEDWEMPTIVSPVHQSGTRYSVGRRLVGKL